MAANVLTGSAGNATINGRNFDGYDATVELNAAHPTQVIVKIAGERYEFYTTDTFTINGSSYTPASATALKDYLSANVFIEGGGGGSTVTYAATKAAADALPRSSGTWVRVASDENNNGDKSMYLDNGTTLEFQFTIQ